MAVWRAEALNWVRSMTFCIIDARAGEIVRADSLENGGSASYSSRIKIRSKARTETLLGKRHTMFLQLELGNSNRT
jgi:hypothetical protein